MIKVRHCYIDPGAVTRIYVDADGFNFGLYGSDIKTINMPRAEAEVAVKTIMDAKFNLNTPKKGSIMQKLFNDLRAFVSENRNVFYWAALIVLLDHFFFKGAFRDKLSGLMNKLIEKVEGMIK